MKPFFVYLLRCADGSYYAGHTDELQRRVVAHRHGEVDAYTRKRRPVQLVWSKETASREEALASELRIKGWSRAKKEALIAGDWARIRQLARGHGPSTSSGRTGGEDDEPSHPQAVRPEPVEGPCADGGHGSSTSSGRTGGNRHPPVRPEPVEGPCADGGHGPSTSSGRTGGNHHPPVRPEPVEGSCAHTAHRPSTSSKRTGGAGDELRHPQPARHEPVEGPCADGRHGPSTSSGRTGGNHCPPPVRPEPVEGPCADAGHSPPTSSGRTGGNHHPPVRPEPVEGPAPADTALRDAVLQRDRRALAKAITLLESTRADHRLRADALLNALLPHTGHAIRLGISGVPGVGKSTFIEALGLMLIGRGHRVAVLAIDPSSSVSGGSILGDKTRMEQLSVAPGAFIRPSPASGTLGGVAEKTREAMLVCEAAGHDVVIVETVGVGQSETAVASMTDMFVLMQLPNAGDDLQAIKKGVMELADLVVINKADLDPNAATRAQSQITSALRLFSKHAHDAERWTARVMPLSALKGEGVDAFWQQVDTFHRLRRASGEFDARRRAQSLAWMWDLVQARLQAEFRQHPGVRDALPGTLRDVAETRVAPSVAARALLQLFHERRG